jgi:hypothetical protein
MFVFLLFAPCPFAVGKKSKKKKKHRSDGSREKKRSFEKGKVEK